MAAKIATAPSAPIASATPSPNCSVEPTREGGLVVHFKIDPLRAKRLRDRAQTMDLASFLWDEILNRAVEGYLF